MCCPVRCLCCPVVPGYCSSLTEVNGNTKNWRLAKVQFKCSSKNRGWENNHSVSIERQHIISGCASAFCSFNCASAQFIRKLQFHVRWIYAHLPVASTREVWISSTTCHCSLLIFSFAKVLFCRRFNLGINNKKNLQLMKLQQIPYMVSTSSYIPWVSPVHQLIVNYIALLHLFMFCLLCIKKNHFNLRQFLLIILLQVLIAKIITVLIIDVDIE